MVALDIGYIVGRRSKLSLLSDCWINGSNLYSMLDIPKALQYTKNFTVGDIIQDGTWFIPQQLRKQYGEICHKILQVQIVDQDDDELIWMGSTNGKISIKITYKSYRQKGIKSVWMKKIWNSYIPPKFSFFAWRLLHKRISTATNLHQWKVMPSSVCVACIVGAEEDQNHMLLHCMMVKTVWLWLSQVMELDFPQYTSIREVIKWSCK